MRKDAITNRRATPVSRRTIMQGIVGAGLGLTVPTALTAAAARAQTADVSSPARLRPGSPLSIGIRPWHGGYTDDYQGSWAELPTGDVLARHDVEEIDFVEVVGEEVQQLWENEDSVHIKDLSLDVRWDPDWEPAEPGDVYAPGKYDHTLFRFRNVGEVVIENLHIRQLDRDYRCWTALMVEGADRVIIRNLYLAGPVHSYHLRIEGVQDLLVENVEIAGIDFDGDGHAMVGGGIWINNGHTSPCQGIDCTGIWVPEGRLPGWQVVQHCYFHDGVKNDGIYRNQDALLIHSPGDGLIFNCVVENWFREVMDSSFDLGFRRLDLDAFANRCLRVERNILRNTTFIKHPHGVGGPNDLVVANNVFVNCQLGEYHKGDNTYHYTHNTFVYDAGKIPAHLSEFDRGLENLASLWNFDAPTIFTNSLIHGLSAPSRMLYANPNEGVFEKWRHFQTDHNVYAVPQGTTWLFDEWDPANRLVLATLDDWRAETGYDEASVQVEPDADYFVDYDGDDLRLSAHHWPGVADPAVLTADRRLRITRDFNGRYRDAATLAPGAFSVL